MTNEPLAQPVSKPLSKPSRFPAYVWDLLFVLILPAVCFALDPIFFGEGLSTAPPLNEAIQLAAYVCVALFVTFFFATYIPTQSRLLRRFLSGSLLAGGSLALIVGILILPYSLVGLLIVFLGVLGFIPFGTAWRYWLRFRGMRFDKPISLPDMLAIGLGLVAPFVLPVLVHAYGQAKFDAILIGVQSSNPETSRAALSNIGESLFCRSHCQSEISVLFVTGKITLAEPEFASLFWSATGVDYNYYLVNHD